MLKIEAKTVGEFDALMNEIWAVGCEPVEGGGMTLYHKHGADMYDEWHNARKVAKHCGFVQLYGNKKNGEDGYTYQCPDGRKVWIATDGGALVVMKELVH